MRSGTLRHLDLESGVWTLQSEAATYELSGLPDEFAVDGLAVIVTGQVRNDLATSHQIGPVLVIEAIEVDQPVDID
jgi:hypothetical protein